MIEIERSRRAQTVIVSRWLWDHLGEHGIRQGLREEGVANADTIRIEIREEPT